jgi:hypothetical protein
LDIGRFHPAAVANLPHNGHIARIQYFRKRLSNAKLQALTYPDDDADAYIAAVEAALGTSIYLALPNATSDAKRIITDFYKAEKDAGRYSLHKRIYLPIYNNLAANAVDAITRTSGTFPISGAVTVAPGYVQGNGTTGYFDFGATPSALGLTLQSASLFALVKTASSQTGSRGMLGASEGGANIAAVLLSGTSAGTLIAFADASLQVTDGYAGAALSTANQFGIFIGSRFSGSTRIQRRITSGESLLTSENDPDTGTVPTTRNIFSMGFNYAGALNVASNAEFGAYGAGLGMSQSNAAAYTLNLKTLWENLTGLTLP